MQLDPVRYYLRLYDLSDDDGYQKEYDQRYTRKIILIQNKRYRERYIDDSRSQYRQDIGNSGYEGERQRILDACQIKDEHRLDEGDEIQHKIRADERPHHMIRRTEYPRQQRRVILPRSLKQSVTKRRDMVQKVYRERERHSHKGYGERHRLKQRRKHARRSVKQLARQQTVSESAENLWRADILRYHVPVGIKQTKSLSDD